MTNLYPLFFEPIFKDKIWGGNTLHYKLDKPVSPDRKCGESWEISGVKGDESVVANGELKGKNLSELLNEFSDKLVGKHVFAQSNSEFPILIKFLDAADDLSIQVHPSDEIALERHNSLGKTEMWYVLDAEKDAKLNVGFNKNVEKEEYLSLLEAKKLDTILNYETVKAGDVFCLPAGRVHYIGKGICIAEIQETSDITYRIYDFDRVDTEGNKRELHTDLALDCIDFGFHEEYKTIYQDELNKQINLANNQYFKTNKLILDKDYKVPTKAKDSFVIYMCLGGNASISFNNQTYSISLGKSVLIPAECENCIIEPDNEVTLLEVYL